MCLDWLVIIVFNMLLLLLLLINLTFVANKNVGFIYLSSWKLMIAGALCLVGVGLFVPWEKCCKGEKMFGSCVSFLPGVQRSNH